MDVHLRDLRYFVAVGEELHFTRAAERLFVSQPALSKQIRQLETALRVTLFVRDTRTVRLTEAGTALLPRARELLAGWDRAQHEVAETAASAEAELVVGFSTGPGRDLLSRVQEEYRQRRPGWRLALRQVPWSDSTAGIADGTTDVAFVWLPTDADALLHAEVLFTEPRVVALPTTHPLATRVDIAFAELLDEPFVALPIEAGALRDFWLAVPERRGNPVRVGARAANADDALEAVAAGQGVALMAAGNAEIYSRPDVVMRPVTGIAPSRLAVVWRRGDDRTAVRDFVAACVHHT